MGLKWYEIQHPEQLDSPSLLFYKDRIEANVRRMVEIAGDPGRLWPHVKTHKCSTLIEMQLAAGIKNFKCATLTEAQMLAKSGVERILYAMQAHPQQLHRLLELQKRFPKVSISFLVDNTSILHLLRPVVEAHNFKAKVFVDLNVGMNRTGIKPDEAALELVKVLDEAPLFSFEGLHFYDGHLHMADLETRRKNVEKIRASIDLLIGKIKEQGIEIGRIVAGGSPTFPIHAQESPFDLSPGTTVLWDHGYQDKYPEMGFSIAAALYTRLISKVNQTKVCLDLGHKSVASEMPLPRVRLLELEKWKQIGQSEEHLVLEGPESNADLFELGQGFYAFPKHICPTVSKYDQALLVEGNRVIEKLKIDGLYH